MGNFLQIRFPRESVLFSEGGSCRERSLSRTVCKVKGARDVRSIWNTQTVKAIDVHR